VAEQRQVFLNKCSISLYAVKHICIIHPLNLHFQPSPQTNTYIQETCGLQYDYFILKSYTVCKSVWKFIYTNFYLSIQDILIKFSLIEESTFQIWQPQTLLFPARKTVVT